VFEESKLRGYGISGLPGDEFKRRPFSGKNTISENLGIGRARKQKIQGGDKEGDRKETCPVLLEV
jgi:hypothetical protein